MTILRKKNKGQSLIGLNVDEMNKLGWKEGEPLNKCIKKGVLIITSLRTEGD